MTFKRPRTYY